MLTLATASAGSERRNRLRARSITLGTACSTASVGSLSVLTMSTCGCSRVQRNPSSACSSSDVHAPLRWVISRSSHSSGVSSPVKSAIPSWAIAVMAAVNCARYKQMCNHTHYPSPNIHSGRGMGLRTSWRTGEAAVFMSEP